MGNSSPLSIVFRLTGVSASRELLESGFGIILDRYEPASESKFYAQIDASDWSSAQNILALMDCAKSLTSDGSIETISMDVALPFPGKAMSASSTIPATVAEAAGRLGIQIEISIYRTSSQ